MRRIVVALAATLVMSAGPDALAGNRHEEHPVTHTATGVVKKVEPAASRITLRHEPIAALGWPAMTMPFTVKDRKVLATLKPEQKVEFQFVQDGGAPVITSIR